MLMVLSPAKKLDFAPAPAGLPLTTPELAADIAELAQTTRKLKAGGPQAADVDLRRLGADSTYQRFQAFDPRARTACRRSWPSTAMSTTGLDARTLDRKSLAWAQDHLRILSGLYGVLRPLDALQPYRLEMGTRLKTRRGASLYDFWKGADRRHAQPRRRGAGRSDGGQPGHE